MEEDFRRRRSTVSEQQLHYLDVDALMKPTNQVIFKWCNYILRRRNLFIRNFSTDFTDGTNFNHLLEILFSTFIPFHPHPRYDMHFQDNFKELFQFCERKNIKFKSYYITEIPKGNADIVAVFLWDIAKQAQRLNDKEALKDYFNKRLQHKYLNQQQQQEQNQLVIKSFDKSEWEDGRLLCVVLSTYVTEYRFCQEEVKTISKNKAGISMTTNTTRQLIEALRWANVRLHLPDLIEFQNYDELLEPGLPVLELYLSYLRDLDMGFEHNGGDGGDSIRKGGGGVEWNLVAYGPGVNREKNYVRVGEETYFTVELRNPSNNQLLNVNEMNVSVTVLMQDNNMRLPCLIFPCPDRNLAYFYVTYMPSQKGMHNIGVHISRVPQFYEIMVENKQRLFTHPICHWFVLWKKKLWVPYTEDISLAIEALNNDDGPIVFGDLEIDKGKKLETNKKKKKSRQIKRATWFWQMDDYSWCPYEEDIATMLENSFQDHQNQDEPLSSFRKEFTIDGKLRAVLMTGDRLKQHRISTNASSEGRNVLRGYLGKLSYDECEVLE